MEVTPILRPTAEGVPKPIPEKVGKGVRTGLNVFVVDSVPYSYCVTTVSGTGQARTTDTGGATEASVTVLFFVSLGNG